MTTLRELLSDEKPREKIIALGPEALTTSELLAIILRTGTKKKNVLELSREVLQLYPLSVLSRKTVKDFEHVPGIKRAKATQLVALFELTRRFSIKEAGKKTIITCSEELFDLVKDDFRDLSIERIMVVLVNSKNHVMRKDFIFQGGIDYSVMDIRELLKIVLLNEASGFFVVHNHPSGDSTPSTQDIQVTKELASLCKGLRVRFLDHIIVGDHYFSFRDDGLLE